MYWNEYLVLYPAARTDSDGKPETSFTLPETVSDINITSIEPRVFANAKNLTEIRLTKNQLKYFEKSKFGAIGSNNFGLDGDKVKLVDVDDTTVDADFRVSGKTKIEVNEGESYTFTVVLTSQPSYNVVLGIDSSNKNEVTVDNASLTFTSDNWDSSQKNVTLTAVDDNIVDGNIDTDVIIFVIRLILLTSITRVLQTKLLLSLL